MSSVRGKGLAVAWLRERVDHQGAECLIWPFSRVPNGHGHFGLNGKIYRAHRFMCELVNGPPPTPKHEASHSCGNGHLGCVNPRHLSWATRSENRREAVRHNRIPKNYRYKLTAEEVFQIRRLEGKKGTLELAKMFGVSTGNIRHIIKRDTWPHVP